MNEALIKELRGWSVGDQSSDDAHRMVWLMAKAAYEIESLTYFNRLYRNRLLEIEITKRTAQVCAHDPGQLKGRGQLSEEIVDGIIFALPGMLAAQWAILHKQAKAEIRADWMLVVRRLLE